MNKREKVNWFPIAFLIAFSAVIIVLTLNQGWNEPPVETQAPKPDRYSMGVEALRNGEYYTASRYLQDADGGKSLYYYAEARINYAYGTDSAKREAAIYLTWIPNNYSGEFADEIKEFKNEREMKKLIDERLKAVRAREEALPKNPPYYGLSVKDIDRTSLGKHTSTSPANVWKNGNVRYYTNYYWAEDGINYFRARVNDLNFVDEVEELRKPVSSSRGRVTVSSDPYHVEEYSSPEDFYYWEEDNFVDYEEAEDYWNAHH